MSLSEKFDKFLRRQFIGEDEGRKVEKTEENKEISATDRAHRMLHMPDEIDKLHKNLEEIFLEISKRFEKKDNRIKDLSERTSTLEISQGELYKELHDSFLGLKKRVEFLELENKNYKDQKSE